MTPISLQLCLPHMNACSSNIAQGHRSADCERLRHGVCTPLASIHSMNEADALACGHALPYQEGQRLFVRPSERLLKCCVVAPGYVL